MITQLAAITRVQLLNGWLACHYCGGSEWRQDPKYCTDGVGLWDCLRCRKGSAICFPRTVVRQLRPAVANLSREQVPEPRPSCDCEICQFQATQE